MCWLLLKFKQAGSFQWKLGWLKLNLGFILGPHSYPESLVRVQKLTDKSVTFYEADLVDKDALRQVFSKVTRSFIISLVKECSNSHVYLHLSVVHTYSGLPPVAKLIPEAKICQSTWCRYAQWLSTVCCNRKLQKAQQWINPKRGRDRPILKKKSFLLFHLSDHYSTAN